MTPKQIIETIGVHNIASAVGKPPNTVGHWKARGIPPKYWPTITRVAAQLDAPQITLEVIENSRAAPDCTAA